MGFADVYTVVTRASDADPNVTSDATETFFWYFNKHGGNRQSLWNYVGVVPALFGLAMMLM